ncbi:MAG: hypothetical protein ABUS54_01490 [Actinomycetota bacterium]
MVDRLTGRGPRLLAVALAAVGLAFASTAGAAGQPQWIVFTGSPHGGFGAEQIFRISVSGTGLKQLTSGKAPSSAPAFSPDGTSIVFARLGGGIYRMRVDGTGLRRLTTNGRDGYPTWSPDGRQIAFIRPVGAGWKVFVMSASGGGARRLPQAPASGRPSWTPRGLVIVTTDGDLARIDPSSGRVLHRYGALIDASIGLTAAAVSPDVSTATFVGPRAPDPGDKDCGDNLPCQHYALYIENLAKHKSPQLLVKNAGPASFSRDGKSLAYVAQNKIVLRVAASGKTTAIATGKVDPTTSTPPAWQPR